MVSIMKIHKVKSLNALQSTWDILATWAY